jgi:hypothetical protein
LELDRDEGRAWQDPACGLLFRRPRPRVGWAPWSAFFQSPEEEIEQGQEKLRPISGSAAGASATGTCATCRELDVGLRLLAAELD